MQSKNCEGKVAAATYTRTPVAFTLLDLSTAHLGAATRELMDNEAADAICYPKGDYGWFVHVSAKDDDYRGIGEHCPSDLADCLRYAQDHGPHWIMFDCDAPCVTSLRVYEAETEAV